MMMSESMDVYRQRFLDHPSDVEAFEAYERELIRAQDMEGLRALFNDAPEELRAQVPNWWMRLLRHLDQACSREEDPAKRAALHLAIGSVYEESLDRADQAIAAYQQAFRVSASMTEALDRARAIYTRSGNWDMILRLWELQQRGVKDAPQRASIHVAMGRVCLDHIGDGARATDYARRALADVPGHPGAQQILDDYADLVRDWRGEVALRVADANEASSLDERVEQLLDTLRFVVERVPREHADGAPIVQILDEVAPSDPRTWILARAWFDRAADAGAAEDAHRRLVGLLEGEERIVALREAAERASKLERTGHELAARRGLLLDAPAEPGNFERLEALAEASEERQLLFEILEDAIRVGAGDGAELSRKAARIAANELERPADAERHWRSFLESRPTDEEALRFITARTRELGHHEELHQRIHELVAHCEPLEAGELLAEAAALAETSLRAPAKAITSWRAFVEVAPETEDGRRALRRLLRQTEQWEPLSTLLAEEVSLSADQRIDTLAALHEELTELWSGPLADPERALHHADQWVRADTESSLAGARLRQIADGLGRSERIRQDLEDRIPRTEGDAQIALINEAARLELAAGARDAARRWIDQLVDVPDTAVDLLRERLAMALEEDDVDAVLRIQGRIVERSRGNSSLIDESMILAEYAENHGRHESACNAYHTVLEEHGESHAHARAGALRTLRALERWEELAKLLATDARLRPQAGTYEELAKVLEDALNEGERAAQARHDALRLEPSQEAAARGLIRWYASREAWQSLEEVGLTSGRVDEAWDAMYERWSDRVSALTSGEALPEDLEGAHERLRALALSALASGERAQLAATTRAHVVRDCAAWVLAADTAQLVDDHSEEHRLVGEAAAICDDAELKAELWTRTGVLAETFGLGISGGWEERTHAWLAIPTSRELRRELALSAEKNGQIHAYASLLDAHVPHVDDALKVEFYRELGRMCTALLEDPDAAREYWESLLTIEPTDYEALTQLLTLCVSPEDAPQRLQLLERLIAQTSGDEQVEYEDARARLLDEVLSDAEGALDAWREIRAKGKGDLPHAEERMEALLRQLERWEDLGAFFSEQLGLADDEERAAAAMVARGQLRLEHLGDENGGVQDLQNLLRSLGSTAAATRAAEVLSPFVESDHSDVVDVLFQWHEVQGGAAEATDILERRVVSHGAQEGGRWRRLLERLRHVDGRERDTARHWIGFQQAHIGTREEAALLKEWASERGTNAILLREWAAALSGLSARPAWWLDVVELASSTGEETDAVLASLRHLRTLDGVDAAEVDDQIEGLLAATDRVEEQVQVILERASAEEGESAARRYVQAATLAEESLRDASRAADWYHSAIRTGSAEPELVFEAFRNYFSAKRWSEAAQLNRDALEAHPDSEYVPRWKALLASAVALSGESDADVLCALRSAAEHRPLLQEVSDGLEHLSFSENVDPAVAREAAELFLSIGVDDSGLEIDLRERVVSLTEDPSARHESLLALGTLLEDMDDQQDRAWDVYAEALALEPLRAQTMDAIQALAARSGAWRASSELYVAQGLQQEPVASQVLFERAIKMESEQLGDLERAAGYLEQLIAHHEATSARYAQLSGWYEDLGDFSRQIDAIDRWAAWAQEQGDEESARTLRHQSASITSERTGNSAQAAQRWRAIADDDLVRRLGALQELSRIYRAEGAWRELDAVLNERVGEDAEAPQREELLRELALIREEELRDAALAVDAWERVVEIRTDAVDALERLEELYTQTGDQAQVYATLQRRFGQTGAVEDRLRLARAGLGLDDVLQDSVEVLCQLITNRTPVAAEAKETLADLADERPEVLSLPHWILLAQVREDAGDLPGAARANLAVAAVTEDPETRATRQWVAVEQRVASSWSLDAAAEDAIRLWGEAQGDPQRLDLVREATRRAGAFARFSEEAEALVDEFSYEWLRRILVRWYTDEAPNADLRRKHLHALYAAHPADAALYEELVQAALPEERIDVWRRRMAATTDDSERQQLRVSLGLALAESDDADARQEAQGLLEQYRMGHSANQRVNLTLRRLYAQGDQWQQLTNLIEEELWLTDDSAARVRLLVERARCRESGETISSIIVEGWFDVLAEDPTQPDAIDALADLATSIDDPFLIARVHDRLEAAFERVGRWRELYELLVLRSAEGLPGERFEMLSRAAGISADHLDDDALSFATLCRMVALKPSHGETVERAHALAVALREPAPLLDAIAQGLQNPRLENDERAKLRRISSLLKAMNPDERPEAVAELSGLFDAQPEWAIVADVSELLDGDVDAMVLWLESRADAVDDVNVRVKLLREASSLVLSSGGDALRAGSLLESIYALTPSESCAAELDKLYKNSDAHEARIVFWRARLSDEAPVVSIARTHEALHDAMLRAEASWEDRIRQLSEWRDWIDEQGAPAEATRAWNAALDQLVKAWSTSPERVDREGDLLDALVRRVDAKGYGERLFRARVEVAGSEDRADKLWEDYIRRRAEVSLSEAWNTATEALRDAPTRELRAASVENLATQIGNLEEATAFLRHLAGQDFEARFGLALRAARLDVQKLNLLERATDTLRRVLEIEPSNTAARGLMREVLAKATRPELRRRVVETLIQTAREPAERASLAMISVFAAHERNDYHESSANLTRALTYDPGNEEARRFLLDRLEDARYLRFSEEHLLPILRDEQAKPELGRLLGRLAETEAKPERKASLNEEIARLQAGDAVAVQAWLKALRLHPHSPSYLDNAVKAVASREDAELLASTILELVNPSLANDVQSALYAAAGRVQLEMLEDAASGEARLLEAMERNPRNENALTGLESYYLSSENYDGLARVLSARLSGAEDEETRRTVAERLITLLRGELSRPDEAARVLESIVGADAREEILLETLRACYREAGDLGGELRTLERLARAASDEDERVGLMSEALALAAQDASLVEETLKLADALLLDDPHCAQALIARERVLSAKGDRGALQAQLALVEILGDAPEVMPAVQHALANGEPSKDDARVIAKMLGQVFDRELVHDADLAAIMRWIPRMNSGELRPVVRQLVNMDATDGQREALVLALAQLRPSTDEALGMEAARVLRAHGSDDPQTIRTIAQWYESAAEVEDAVVEYTRLLPVVENPAERGELLLRIASLEERRQNFDEVMRLHEAALREGYSSSALFEALARGYERAGRWDKVVETLQRRSNTVSGEERVKFLRRAGSVARERLGDADLAFRCLNEAVASGDKGPGQVDLLELKVLTGQLDGIEQKAQELRRLELSREDLHRLEVTVGMLELQRRNYAEAKSWLESARNLNVRHARTLLLLGRANIGLRQWNDALEALQAALVNQDQLQLEERAMTFVLLGRVQLQEGSAERARELCTRALRLRPDYPQALELLAELDKHGH